MSNLSAASSALSARPSVAFVDVQPGRQAGQDVDPSTRQKQAKMQEVKDRFERLQDQRRRDALLIEERRRRKEQKRDARLEAAIENLYSESMMGAQVATEIFGHEARQAEDAEARYHRWDTQVSRRVEYHVGKFMNSVALPPPPGLDRCKFQPKDDPLKVCLINQQEEESFHRTATAILQDWNNGSTAAAAVERKIAARPNHKPILPPEHWSAEALKAMNGFAAEGRAVRPARKMGRAAHLAPLDESDGKPVFGKTKFQNQRGLLGTLDREPRDAEATKYKTPAGASSGAPCQDHYDVLMSKEAVAAELPLLGKRFFPQLSARGQ